MSKSGFRPPALKDKKKWTENFQNFVKLSLTKQPKRRPAADKLLEVCVSYLLSILIISLFRSTVTSKQVLRYNFLSILAVFLFKMSYIKLL